MVENLSVKSLRPIIRGAVQSFARENGIKISERSIDIVLKRPDRFSKIDYFSVEVSRVQEEVRDILRRAVDVGRQRDNFGSIRPRDIEEILKSRECHYLWWC